MTNQQLGYWAAVYNKLNRQHDLWRQHGISFDAFIKSPDYHQYWITLYFANPALLINRPHGAAILLPFFLSDPNLILLSALMADSLLHDHEPEQRDLLPRQQAAAAMLWWSDSMTDRQVELRGNRYMEPFHHYHAPHRYKCGHHHRKTRSA